MSKWISIMDRLPMIGQDVWIRKSMKNGQPHRFTPIFPGYYGLLEDETTPMFRYQIGTWGTPEYCLKKGVTHWMPMVDNIQPEFWDEQSPAKVYPVVKNRVCSATDCDMPVLAKGMCNKHYMRDYLARHKAARTGQ